ncbi:dual specificity tyrosine-phosphorylation-regulated kinase 4-like protein [Lates japonicus]|uniref:dual-specificity kinase n=1 Tax=Lates japonicus TaxID=270547 RepID=A0AAD3REK7_LATJO|nr:dual specificity tyrosine-phosphorylation-regulated kinase 4-like protein [Lates japonicus]
MYELKEIKDYKQVWFLGKKASKTRYSKVTKTKGYHTTLQKDDEKRTAVSDFGGSYFVKDRDQPLIQTLYYMSPEMLLGKRCSPATDMWSLGCMLAELHLGHRLFHGRDNVDQFSCIMKVLGTPPTELLVEAPKRNKFFVKNPTTTTTIPPQTFQIKRIQLCAAVRPPYVTALCCSVDRQQ